MPFTPTPTIGDDVLTDTAGDDSVDALAGNDTITVTRGFDNVNGNTGRDRLIVSYSGATQGVSTDNGALGGTFAGGYSGRFGQGNSLYTVDFSGIEDFTVTTGNSNDSITVGDGDDVVILNGGDDFANFGSGNDSGDGGTGTDGFSANMSSTTWAVAINLVTGAAGAFVNFEYLGTLTTGSGNDTIVTRGDVTAFETISTGAGADTITVARGLDTVHGGADRDRLIIDYSGATQGVRTEDNFLNGTLATGYSRRISQGNSNYTVDFTGIEDFTVTTGDASDNITVGDGDDIVNLGNGDDFASFGSGNDSGDGGAGTDGFSANLGSATTAIAIDLQTGISATFSNFEYLGTLTTGSGNDVVVTRADVTAFETINTGAGADTITVARGLDAVHGGADRDRLIIDYSGATQGVFTEDNFLNGSLATGYARRIGQGNTNYTVDFTGIEDFTVTTGNANDNITVGDGDDVVNLNGGDDFVNFGSGNDSGDGGSGTDGFSANLGAVTAAVGVNLVTGVSATFANFEFLGTLTTGSGNDIIVTRGDITGNETINTGAGADTITVARGFDTVNGGADRDRLIIDYSGATQNVGGFGFSGSLASGYDGRIWQGNALYTVDFTGIEDFTVTGSNNDDNITVGDGDDVVNLGSGNDFVSFGAGNDSGDGGIGTDGFSANLGGATAAIGIDLQTGVSASFANFEYVGTLTTGSGNDMIVTRNDATNNETINTGAGTDTITVARGFDTVNGGADRDRLIIDYSGATQGVGTDSLSGTLAAGYAGRIWQGNALYTIDFSNIEDFTVTTGNSNDGITVGDGNDVVATRAGDDTVNSGSGNDVVDGGDGNDSLNGGGDIDTLSYASAAAGVTVSLSIATAQVTGGAGTDTISGFENVTGSAFADNLTGTADANQIDGGAGDDLMAGGAGDDIYIIDSELDIVTEVVGAGIDEIRSSARKISLAANVENLTYIGNGNFSARGNSLGNVMTGGANEDILFGKGGDDRLIGGTGHDILDGGAGTDEIEGGDGNDIVYVGDASDTIDGGAGTDTIIFYASDLVFAASQSTDIEIFENLSGGNLTAGLNASDNLFGGSVGIDIVDGGGGNDVLYGREGNDQFTGGDGSDRLFGMADNDVLDGGNDRDFLYGDTGNDRLSGGADDDVLYGEDGDDDLTGGSGIDLLGGGIGADDFIFAAGDSGSSFATADRIIDFSSAQGDRIDLSAIDAVTGGSDDGFTFIGDTAFGNIAGQLRAETISGITYVMGDVDGDGIADFVIKLDGTVPLSAGDFLL